MFSGAGEWGSNFPDANGKKQSPVNISSRDAVYNSALSGRPLQFQYVLCRETDICNNGHTVVTYLKYKPGTKIQSDIFFMPIAIIFIFCLVLNSVCCSLRH